MFVFEVQTRDPSSKVHSLCLFLKLGLEKPTLAFNLLGSLYLGFQVHAPMVSQLPLFSNQTRFTFYLFVILKFWAGKEKSVGWKAERRYYDR